MRVFGPLAATALLIFAACPPAMAAPAEVDHSRDTLAANDGWAAATTGTTGGAAADAAHVFIVTNRSQLVAALNNLDTTPKIIKVFGTVEGNVDGANNPLTCDDYSRGTGYTLAGYLATYDPAVWGRTTRPSGPMEDARAQSQRNQAARVQIRVGSNTTIIGVGDNPTLNQVNLFYNNVNNVIIRNLHFSDAFDCFPQWDPTDGSTGNWNSQYDNMSLRGTTHAWIDHNAYDDGAHPDSTQPLYFGRPFQWHDGECDITNASDLDTVSWNRFTDHDKTDLIGSSDSGNTAANDRGKLRITFHHNLFDGLGQRTPRVRFGQDHVYNNLYNLDPADFVYSWGVGIESHIFAESNVFNTNGITAGQLITRFNGTVMHETNNVVNGVVTDIRGAYNATHTPAIADDTSWTPTLFTHIDSTADVPSLVLNGAGQTLSTNSLQLDGAGGFAEAPHTSDLNLSGNWTVELWFKDENPAGFNHDYLTLLNKGDRGTSGEAPFTVSIGFKALQIGTRDNFTDTSIRYDLRAGGVDPAQWHHVAATLSGTLLTIYLDGIQVAQGAITPSSGNSLAVEIGRNGPASGKYFQGKIDDVRLWNVARSATDIAASFKQQLPASTAGLVANWKFDEPTGSVAVDSAAGENATLGGGASFSPLTHP